MPPWLQDYLTVALIYTSTLFRSEAHLRDSHRYTSSFDSFTVKSILQFLPEFFQTFVFFGLLWPFAAVATFPKKKNINSKDAAFTVVLRLWAEKGSAIFEREGQNYEKTVAIIENIYPELCFKKKLTDDDASYQYDYDAISKLHPEFDTKLEQRIGELTRGIELAQAAYILTIIFVLVLIAANYAILNWLGII